MQYYPNDRPSYPTHTDIPRPISLDHGGPDVDPDIWLLVDHILHPDHAQPRPIA